MSNSCLSLYHALVDGDELPVSIQHAILAVAEAGNDTGLLAQLARRDGLAPEVRDTLSRHTAAKVRATFLSRDDVTPGELAALLAGEKRVTVLQALAEAEEASAAVLTALSHNPHPRIALAITARDDAPEEAQLRAFGHLATGRKKLSRSDQYQYRRLIAASALANRLAETTLDPEQLCHLASSKNLSVFAQQRIVDRIIAPALAGDHPDVSLHDGRRTASELADCPVLDKDVASQLVTLVTKSGADKYTLTRLQKAMLHNGNHVTGEQDDPVKRRYHQAVETRDTATLGMLIGHARDVDLAQLLAVNPALDVELARKLARATTDRTATTKLARRYPTDYETMVALFAGNVGLLDMDAVARLGEGAADRLIADLGAIEDRRARDRALTGLLSTFIPTDEQLLALPWTFLAGVGARTRQQIPPARLSRLLDQQLTTPDAWELFHGLADGFEGSLGELVGAATLLHTKLTPARATGPSNTREHSRQDPQETM